MFFVVYLKERNGTTILWFLYLIIKQLMEINYVSCEGDAQNKEENTQKYSRLDFAWIQLLREFISKTASNGLKHPELKCK